MYNNNNNTNITKLAKSGYFSQLNAFSKRLGQRPNLAASIKNKSLKKIRSIAVQNLSKNFGL